MTIEIPDEWAPRFQVFEQAEGVLRSMYEGAGVSRQMIAITFGAFGGRTAIWNDPAFRVWAAVRGCIQYGDFLERWKKSGNGRRGRSNAG